MTQSASIDAPKKKSLPIAGKATLDIDDELKRFEAEERARLGLEIEKQWLEEMADLGFTKSEKADITLVIGGLTMAHDYLVEGAFRSLGYNVLALDAPDYDALRVGKEFGNRGQCNPTYFTVGNLVKFLIQMRDGKGMTSEQVVKKFVFLTAGACGPCRFGMYTTEYRKALRDAGFDGFRVMLFQQQGGLSQATGEESGLEMNPKFFISLLKALLAGDVINGIGYRLRPYELETGATDKAIAEAKKVCYEALLNKKSILVALNKARKIFGQVKVDRLLPKPRVAIIGEFWAMTTEGDGNYQLQRFVEQEGGETDIQFITAWLLYNLWEVRNDTKNRALLRQHDTSKYGLGNINEFGVLTRQIGLWVGDLALRAAFQTYANIGGFHGYHLADMDAVADVAAPYYNNDLRGGEGHMEVGKLILNVVKSKATMTLSVKPFGCMPSSGVSDGVQSLITEKFPGTIYCAVETSGDGAVNFQSRVQMYLFKARQAATAEFEKALSDTGLTVERVREYLAAHPRMESGLYRAPHAGASTAVDVIYHVGERINTPALVRAKNASVRFVTGAATSVKQAVLNAPRTAKSTAAFTIVLQKELTEIAREKGPALAQAAASGVRAKVAKVAKVLPFGAKKAAETESDRDLSAAAE
jgi:predicted nucleotide-binding protein (sugar kinase/HSP70/actin superfamily)